MENKTKTPLDIFDNRFYKNVNQELLKDNKEILKLNQDTLKQLDNSIYLNKLQNWRLKTTMINDLIYMLLFFMLGIMLGRILL